MIIEQDTPAFLWKASNYRLVGGPLSPDFIAASPNARWTRSDPFGSYRPADDRSERGDPPPHVVYANLAYRAEHADWSDKATELFHRAMKLFVDRYGLLGWFEEEFAAPMLPDRAIGAFVRLAPDTIIGEDGVLHSIDPSTEGRHRQEQLMLHRDEQESAQLGLPPPRPSDYHLEPEELVLPCELRFQRPTMDFVRTEFSRSAYHGRDNEVFTYEDVQQRYGVRVVFDPEHSDTGVVVLPTREPVTMWHTLTGLNDPVSVSYLNRQLDQVRPRLVVGEDGKRAGGWACPSLLTAVHTMFYLDVVNRIEMKKCQAPGCLDYFRVGPHGESQLYCPPPPGKKQSKCASRASSAKYRERQRLARA